MSRLLLGGLGFGLCLLWASPVLALKPGEIIIAEKAPPKRARQAALLTFMEANKVSVLTRQPGKQSWPAHLVAHLRFTPSIRLLSLPQNNLRLFLAFYRRDNNGWVRDNVDDVEYRPGSQIISFPYRFAKTLGLFVGAQYQLRITLLDQRNNEVLLASTLFTLK